MIELIATATEAKLSELATTIELHDRGADARLARAACCPTSAREKMERVRTLGEQLLEPTRPRRSPVGRQSVYQTLWLNRIGVSAMAAVSLLALFMYLRQTATLDRALADEDAQRMAGERDRLEPEVAARTGAAEGARAAPADDPRGRAQPARARAARRARRPAHRRQARRRPAQVAPRRDRQRRGRRAAGPPQRGAQRRHRPEAPDHRGPAALVAQQPRPGRRARDPAARVRGSAARSRSIERARAGRAQPGGAAHDLPPGPGGADQRRQVRQGHRGRRSRSPASSGGGAASRSRTTASASIPTLPRARDATA